LRFAPLETTSSACPKRVSRLSRIKQNKAARCEF
jgi:hypothetical protein